MAKAWMRSARRSVCFINQLKPPADAVVCLRRLMTKENVLIKFRPVPDDKDSLTGAHPPSTWPNPPATGYVGSKTVESLVQAAWQPWWTGRAKTYATRLTGEALEIHHIAHAMHIDSNNGWDMAYCLSHCQQHLADTAVGVAVTPNVAVLPSSIRGNVDEEIASAVTIALAMKQGYEFVSQLSAPTKQHVFIGHPAYQKNRRRLTGIVTKRWAGNGPDHLVAKAGAPRDGFVSEFMFLEAKGVAAAFQDVIPKNFYEFKTQSLNADMTFASEVRPILSYVYLPAAVPPEPVVAQWFNATRRQPREERPMDDAAQALTLLLLAFDQFWLIVQKSKLPFRGMPDSDRWRIEIQLDGTLCFVSEDQAFAMSVDPRALRLFTSLSELLERCGGITGAEELRLPLLHAASRLRGLRRLRGFRSGRTPLIGSHRFAIIARDATGIDFLRRIFE